MIFRFITLSLHLAALLAFAVLPSCDKDPLNSGTSGSGDNTGDITGGNGGSGNDGGYTAEEGRAYVFNRGCIRGLHITETPNQ